MNGIESIAVWWNELARADRMAIYLLFYLFAITIHFLLRIAALEKKERQK